MYMNFNYFDILEMQPTFLLDAKELRRQYLILSKKYHPDFHTQESGEIQAAILAKSSLLNKAYNTLKEEYSLMGYVLTELGQIGEGVKHELPQEFLLEMMEVNESLMDLQFDPDSEKMVAAKAQIQRELDELRAQVVPHLSVSLEETAEPKGLEMIKDYYLKRKYLLRMLENLDSFAGADKEM